MGFLYGDNLVSIAVQDQHGAGYSSGSFRHVDFLQIFQQRRVEPAPVIESIAGFTPAPDLSRRQQPVDETFRV
jgi:hypothetical protein